MSGKLLMSRQFADFDAPALVETVATETQKLLTGKPISSGHYNVIFTRECLSEIVGVFLMAISGKAAKDGINPWREKIGSQVADARFSLADHPQNAAGFGYSLFDSEGLPTKALSIIEQGQLKTLLHNTATAHYFGLQSTGHAVRGTKSALGVSAQQLALLPGEANSTELYEGTVLEIHNLQGLHSGANAITGDYSFGASGYLYKDGEPVEVVRGITVAGNFYDMIQRINLVGDSADWNWSKSMHLPLMQFADLAVSGK
jgi:PmbA protein